MIDYPDWYKIPQVKFRMIPYTFNREVMFIKQDDNRGGRTTRMIRIHNVQGFDVWFRVLHIDRFNRGYSLYYSLAKYNSGIPFSTLDLAKRDFGDWVKDHWKNMVSYDFLLDIDAGNHNEMDFAHYSARNIKDKFDELNVPYHLRFSGRGFHFVIPYEYFPIEAEGLAELHCFNPESDYNIYNIFMNIAMQLHSRYSEMIDTTIYDSRRVTKIPYSLALYDGRNYVCTSFNDDEEFENFELKNCRPSSKYHEIASVNKWKEHLFNPKGNVFKLLNELGI